MASKMTTATRCLFCNSATHSNDRCNSNMNGRKVLLIDTCKSILWSDVMPNFNSFKINELKYIANRYNIEVIPSLRIHRRPAYKIHRNDNVVRWLSNPVSLTLTKRLIVKQLNQMWLYFTDIRDKKKHKPVDDDCPVCLDQMTIHIWSDKWLRWEEKSYNHHINNGRRFTTDVITLPCDGRHRFCGRCWTGHKSRNGRIIYQKDSWGLDTHVPTDKVDVTCPLCRAHCVDFR